MKLNNKGFAISTILYGLLALLILIVMLIFQVMRTNNNNSKELGASVQNDLEVCRAERKRYSNCNGVCTDESKSYKGCLKCKTQKQAYNECKKADPSASCGDEQTAYNACLTSS